MFVQDPVFALPLLSNRLWDKVVDQVGKAHSEILMPWTVKLNTMELTDHQKEVVQDLLVFLLQQLHTARKHSSTFFYRFQAYLVDHHQMLESVQVLATLAHFEETVCKLLHRRLDRTDAELGCAWIRNLVLNLYYITFEAAYLPAGPFPENNEEWTSPLVRLLNRTSLKERWQWVALFTSEPEVRILELAVRENEGHDWKSTAVQPDLTQQILTGLYGHDPGICRQTVVPGIGLAAAGSTSPSSRHRLKQIAQWLRVAFDLSTRLVDTTPSRKAHRLRLYEAVLQFDEILLQSKNLEEIITSTVEKTCRIGGFRRSALFWYTPLTRSVYGVHAFNIPRENIQCIREPVENLSGIQEVFEKMKPVHFENIHRRLPDHYVESFHLSSLLVCPIPVVGERQVAVLLLDQDGTPFQADEGTLFALDTMMSRAAKAMSARLAEPATKVGIPSSGVLTPREQQILQFIADGLDTKEISQHLHLSEYTVSEYVRAILRRLQVPNRSAAVAKAMRQNIIQ